MAGYVAKLKGDINDIRTFIDGRITGYSMSCTKEESYAKNIGGVDFAIDVYERYSYIYSENLDFRNRYIYPAMRRQYQSCPKSGSLFRLSG